MAPTAAPPAEYDEESILNSAELPPEEGFDVPDEATGPRGPGETGLRTDLITTLGGMTGAQFGGPVVPARGLGAAIGGGVGNLAGRVSEDLERGGLYQAGQNLAQNLIEAAKSGLIQGSAEMAMPVAGQLVAATPGVKQGAQRLGGMIAQKIGDWTLPKMTPAVEGMSKRLTAEGAPGLTPSQRLDPTRGEEAKFTQLGENIAYHAWFGGPLKHTYKVNEEAAQAAFSRFTDTMKQLSPKDFEGVARQVLTGRIKQNMYEPMNKIYDDLRSRVPGNVVESTGLLKDLRDPNSKVGNIVIKGLQNIRESSKDTSEIDSLIKTLSTPKSGTGTQALAKLSFNQALRLKTQLNQLAEGPVSTDPDVRVMMSTAGRLANQVDSSIRQGLTKAQTNLNDPTLVQSYDNASKTYARLAGKYQNDFVQKVIKTIDQKPGTLAELLLPSTVTHPEQQKLMIEAVRGAYGPRWNTEVRPLLAASLASRAFDATSGRYNGVAMAGQLKSYGSELLDHMLGPKTGQALMDHARTLERVAERPKGSGSVFIQLAQASALTGGLGAATGFAFTGDYEDAVKGGSATILIAPWVLGHLYGNPTWLKAVDKGLMQFKQTGKPPSILTTTLRQAAAVAGGPTFEQALTTEKAPSLVQAALSRRPEPTPE